MDARIDQAHHLSTTHSCPIGNGDAHKSLGELVRQWGPYVITALLVPGGIAIALGLLLRRWHQKRQALLIPARV